MDTVRERLERDEERLSPLAARSRLSLGRETPEEECPWRLSFQRDRDRILHSKAFRRLKHKTQVFVAPAGDHYRTRLTHTLEVSQIARTIARALRLNEDLTEAIALGHDLGHTPFGHAGEEALNGLMPGGFRHNEQSLRVVDALEKSGRGLNLTREVREGILLHSKVRQSIAANAGGVASTLEGQIVRVADSIAYVNHDLEDAVRAGVIREADMPSSLLKELGSTGRARINAMVVDIITNCWSVAEGRLPEQPDDGGPVIRPSLAMLNCIDSLREFLFQRVYLSGFAKEQGAKATYLVQELFKYYLAHPSELPADLGGGANESVERLICDHIASMTDRYALHTFRELFVPEG
ncbi:MAG: deoxyguanosinetriphosphate triphosphohydrolase [Sphingomonadaceae bacterium]